MRRSSEIANSPHNSGATAAYAAGSPGSKEKPPLDQVTMGGKSSSKIASIDTLSRRDTALHDFYKFKGEKSDKSKDRKMVWKKFLKMKIGIIEDEII